MGLVHSLAKGSGGERKLLLLLLLEADHAGRTVGTVSGETSETNRSKE